ncbi:hypothetical protein [Micromonospora echinaurantiaca]|uniref:hypothetical protein n=1 Tax=Micromonospora echinaurantiaca TaxID=47857 RepID=UPI0034429827
MTLNDVGTVAPLVGSTTVTDGPPPSPSVAVFVPARRRLLARRRVAAALAFAVSVLVAAGGGALFVQSRTAEDRRLADQYRQTLAVANGRYRNAG